MSLDHHPAGAACVATPDDAFVSTAKPPPAKPGKPAAKPQRATTRIGRKGVAFWVEPDARRKLRILSAEEERTVQSLMEEALELLFRSRDAHVNG